MDTRSGQPFVLGTDVVTGLPVTLSDEDRTRCLYVIGKNGTGKSTLIEQMIDQDMRQGTGVCLFDPHGDLTGDLLYRIPQHRLSQVRYLDLERANFSVNLFQCGDPGSPLEVEKTCEQVFQVLNKLFPELFKVHLVERVLRNVSLTLIANPGTGMANIPALLTDESYQARLLAGVKNPTVRQFWDQYNSQPPVSRDQFWRQPLLTRIDKFLSNELVWRIVRHPRTSIDFRAAMDEGQLVFIKLSAELEESTTLIGSVLLFQLLNAALSRKDVPRDERRQFNVYADEYHRFQTPAFATLLDEARKYKVATTIAHQRREQLDYGFREAPMGAASLAIFEVGGTDAADLVENLTPKLRLRPTRQQHKQVIAPNPVEELLAHPRQDDQVDPLIDRLFRQPFFRDFLRGPELRGSELGAPAWLTILLVERVNTYLRAAMLAGPGGGDPAVGEALLLECVELALRELFRTSSLLERLYFGTPEGHCYGYSHFPEEARRRMVRDMIGGRPVEAAVARALAAFRLGEVEHWLPYWSSSTDRAGTERVVDRGTAHAERCLRLMAGFVADCVRLAELLRERPVYVPGELEDVLEEESIDNAKERLRIELTSFEQRFGGARGYCYAKVPSGEHTIKTHQPDPVHRTPELQRQVATILGQRWVPAEPEQSARAAMPSFVPLDLSDAQEQRRVAEGPPDDPSQLPRRSGPPPFRRRDP